MQIKKSKLRRVLRLFLFAGWCLLMPTLFLLGKLFRVKGYQNIVHVFHAGCCRIFGLNVSYLGEMQSEPPTLFVSNHISYLDIPVIGNVPAYFIAKSEIASWPVVGWLAGFQNTLFFERKSARAKHQLHIMHDHLQDRKSLILFPEGTSTDGVHVEPFKSSLFEVANFAFDLGIRVPIQPVTIAYVAYDGQAMTQDVLDYYAWYADMTFGVHVLEMLSLKKVDVKVMFHPVVYLDEFETRKHCADHCQSVVAQKLATFLSEASQTEEEYV